MDYENNLYQDGANGNGTTDSLAQYMSSRPDTSYSSNADFVINGVLVPTIGLLGVAGNLLNLMILSWRCWRRDDDTLEKVALVGLIALAASDMCFCITIIPNFTEWKSIVIFDCRCFSMYFKLYGTYAQNVFIKTSTWLTMVVACARYIAICHPLRARICFGLTATKVAIVTTFIFWFIVLLPLLWEFKFVPFTLDNSTRYYTDTGAFRNNLEMRQAFTYIWAFLGYFIPVAILAFCNVNLIKALRESRLLRESAAAASHGNINARRSNRRITLTLVALVLMFMLLVSPSELLHFCMDVSPAGFRAFEIGILITNVLQAINFAFHFVLYCAVNVTFRRTLVTLGFLIMSFIRTPRWSRNSARGSFSGRSTFVHSVLRSNETNI